MKSRSDTSLFYNTEFTKDKVYVFSSPIYFCNAFQATMFVQTYQNKLKAILTSRIFFFK